MPSGGCDQKAIETLGSSVDLKQRRCLRRAGSRNTCSFDEAQGTGKKIPFT